MQERRNPENRSFTHLSRSSARSPQVMRSLVIHGSTLLTQWMELLEPCTVTKLITWDCSHPYPKGQDQGQKNHKTCHCVCNLLCWLRWCFWFVPELSLGGDKQNERKSNKLPIQELKGRTLHSFALLAIIALYLLKLVHTAAMLWHAPYYYRLRSLLLHSDL